MDRDINSNLFTEALPLGDHWEVAPVEPDHQEHTVEVRLAFKEQTAAVCPQCRATYNSTDIAPEASQCFETRQLMQAA